jgi:hypothetical protein
LSENFETLWEQTRPAFEQERTWERAKRIAMSSLVCLGRHSITGLVSASGKQFEDWTSDYRLFEKERIDMPKLFSPVRDAVNSYMDGRDLFSVVMDDTKIRKRGKRIYGTGWDRDPLGPPFSTNFIWSQRFLQLSAIVPKDLNQPSSARAIPIDFKHCPRPVKPKRNAAMGEWEKWKEEKKKTRLCLKGVEALINLREQMNATQSGSSKTILASVDGGYTNGTVIKKLPAKTTLIGRIRKDAKLHEQPETSNNTGKGRKRFYGNSLPTPEKIRQDETMEWIKINAFATNKIHEFHIKTVTNVRWRGAGENDLRLVIIKPLAYRLRKKSKLLYRDPAYLICTDPLLSLETILQNYLWRWEIEVNFRDEKTLLGVGEDQTRTPAATSTVPAFMVAAYSYLLLANQMTFGKSYDAILPRPKWQNHLPIQRMTTSQMINQFRISLWGKALGVSNKNDFVSRINDNSKSLFYNHSPSSAIFYAIK